MSSYGRYGTGTKENNLSMNTALSSSDEVRIVSNRQSRSISVSDFADSIQAFFASDGIQRTIRSVTTSQAILSTDDIVAVDAGGGAKSLTLPDATDTNIYNSSTLKGKAFTIKKNDDVSGNAVTINPVASQTIDGQSALALSGSGRPFVTLITNGAEWLQIG